MLPQDLPQGIHSSQGHNYISRVLCQKVVSATFMKIEFLLQTCTTGHASPICKISYQNSKYLRSNRIYK